MDVGGIQTERFVEDVVGQTDHGLSLRLATDFVQRGPFPHRQILFREMREQTRLAVGGVLAPQDGQPVVDAIGGRGHGKRLVHGKIGEVGSPFQRDGIDVLGERQAGASIDQTNRQAFVAQAPFASQASEEVGIGGDNFWQRLDHGTEPLRCS